MGRHGGRGEAAVSVEGLQHEAVILEDAQGAVGTGTGAGGDGGAFQDLAQVQGQARIKASQHGQGRKHRGVVGAPGDNHAAAGGQGLLQGLHSHLGNQRRAVLHRGSR